MITIRTEKDKKRLLKVGLVVPGIILTSSALYAADGLIKVTDMVYAYADVKDPSPANSFGVKAGIMIGEKGILIIDNLPFTKGAKRFTADIRRISDKKWWGVSSIPTTISTIPSAMRSSPGSVP
jgi:hypothetical protein